MAEPKFIPQPGQVDYTNIRYCPVVNCVITYEDEILLQQRSPDMRLYPSYWSGVSGFLDSKDSIEAKVHEELDHEAGIKEKHIASLDIKRPIRQEAPEYGKTWIVFPIHVALKQKVEPTINWESRQMRWLKREDIKGLDLLPGFTDVLDVCLDF